ncbi:tail fiber protein [Comamonas sp. Z3]|uniref:phage tail protein n=1 Tax=Comamonas sp. Z3 TaxID=2601247 RepID=UPI0011E794EF|nr:tail fiber protein [Comamonas sp. Z3]TYK73505.1 tail fiber protein [Comamonas sp. Z3]
MKIRSFLPLDTWATRAAALAILGAAPMGDVLACGTEDYTGSVCVVAFSWCPAGTERMDGRVLQINNYQALYSLIGVTYGGDGKSTFQLPDMRGRVSAGYTSTAESGFPVLPLGKKDGNESVLLKNTDMPTITGNMKGTASGQISVPLTGATVTGQSISGNVTVNALNGNASPTGGVAIPTNTNNTVGKTGSLSNFYPSGSTPIAVPSSHNLTVSGGSVTGQAAGAVTMEVTGTVAVGPGPTTAVPTVPPRLALNYCMVVNGLYPQRP